MLEQLTISNFALIQQVEMKFNSGFTIITGETGAGKSIILGALSLVLGKRANAKQLFDASKKCIIEARFLTSNQNIQSFFESNDFDIDDTILLRRELLPNGKSRAFINDTPATVKQLETLGGYLIDIHAQHENLRLADRTYRTFVIDAFIGQLDRVERYQHKFEQFKKLQKELKANQDEQLKQLQEQDYIRFLVEELEPANIQDGELTILESKLSQLEHAEEIKTTIWNINEVFNGEDGSVVSKITEVSRLIGSIDRYAEELGDFGQRINSLHIELDDIVTELSAYLDKIELNDDELEVTRSRVNEINGLLSKHHVSTEMELMELYEQYKVKLSAIDVSEAHIIELKDQLKVLEEELSQEALEISRKRSKSAQLLSKELIRVLSQLGMPQAKIEVKVDQQDELDFLGYDQIAFNFSANKGHILKPIQEAASGGELSRVLLAIKSVIGAKVNLPAIVFDEIDTGVSGEIANNMGDLMRKISNSIQVMAITHLPQVAAKGKYHYTVYKDHSTEKTLTKMRQLDKDDRIIELAKMLSGDDPGEAAQENARILLDN